MNDRVDSDGYPMTFNDICRDIEDKKYREEQDKKLEGHIPYASDRCKCQKCCEDRQYRYSRMDDPF